MSLVLVGLPGSGKSAVARRVGMITGLPVTDTDEVLLARHGDLLGPDPQATDWQRFRAREEAICIESLADSGARVLSLGGGAWLASSVRQVALRAHLSAYLRARPETLIRRGVAQKRVMFRDADICAHLERLEAERGGIYAQAGLTIDTDDLTVDAVAQQLVTRVLATSRIKGAS